MKYEVATRGRLLFHSKKGYFERYRLEDYLDNSLYKRTVERLFEERKPVYHDHIR